MRHIMVLNAKGGCGKSTLATNIAGFYADEGKSVALADFDPQRSSLDWLDTRPSHLPTIEGVKGFDGGLKGVSRGTDIVVLDAPARSHGKELTALLNHAETVVVPVLPSTIDMQATSEFLKEIYASGRYKRKQIKVGLIGNRVRENTLIFDELDQYLNKQRAAYIASLREAQNYVRAYSRGYSIFDLPEYIAWPDWEQWDPVVQWLDSKRSQP
ncbi:MAG: ParA family protein [Pseudomonadota bacterium]